MDTKQQASKIFGLICYPPIKKVEGEVVKRCSGNFSMRYTDLPLYIKQMIYHSSYDMDGYGGDIRLLPGEIDYSGQGGSAVISGGWKIPNGRVTFNFVLWGSYDDWESFEPTMKKRILKLSLRLE